MNIVDKVLIFCITSLFFLIIVSQLLLENEKIAPYVNETIHYEGVVKSQQSKVVETIDQNK
ncbi:hypothetical protein CIB95_07260 [Lottiidibacillus patelloidae]|uniref:Uncharacterized protein n=1 Tax=Lottiidibacillus patelloidae TaxID=2670334 RepID=A0A263BU42_9BACI|nr:DUF5359 family protein [Lottiidibacillus patelloidae]OZM57254.1 hypothetical protein CIB95_07260 [Lottiidibacillus patelloidae]